MSALFSEADGQRVLDVDFELPTADELRLAADQQMPIHVGQLPAGTVDLDFLEPIADRIRDLRVFSAGIESVDAINRMTGLQHLIVDAQLQLPAIDLQHHLALETYWGRLTLAPEVLNLPALREAGMTIPPGQPLRVVGNSLHSLHVAHSPRAGSLGEITCPPSLETLGLSSIRDFSLAALPHLANLEELSVSRVATLRDIDALRQFHRLRRLNLTDVRHLDLEAISHLDIHVYALRTLPVADRPALKALPNVTFLE